MKGVIPCNGLDGLAGDILGNDDALL